MRIQIKNGLRQGYVQSLKLFNLALEKVIKESLNNKEMDVIGNSTLIA